MTRPRDPHPNPAAYPQGWRVRGEQAWRPFGEVCGRALRRGGRLYVEGALPRTRCARCGRAFPVGEWVVVAKRYLPRVEARRFCLGCSPVRVEVDGYEPGQMRLF
jgi:hypothetical protein